MMTDSFENIFQTLRAFYATQQDACVVLNDEPSRYYLGTHEVREKDGYRTWFGGVEVKKSYVSAHLMPVYIYPQLLDGMSEKLSKRMQGKSCFNFKKSDPTLFQELESLINAGFVQFKKDGRL